jgi:hypothetical protein
MVDGPSSNCNHGSNGGNGHGYATPPWCADPLNARAAAGGYYRDGCTPIWLSPRSKNPNRPGWQETHYQNEEELDRDFPEGKPLNVGLLCGESSGGRTDVDLDCHQALILADRFLLLTRRISGRSNNLRSHRWYCVAGQVGPTAQFKDIDGESLVELRSTGAQTLVPPSTHDVDGDRYHWDEFGPPTVSPYDDLLTRVKTLAAAVILARHWPAEGSRQDAALALAGGLARAGWDALRVSRFVESVAVAAGDPDVRQRLSAVGPSVEKVARGEKVRGWPALAELVGDKAATRAREWLRLRGVEGDNGHAGGGQAAGAEGAGAAVELATAADLIRVNATIRWAWPGWLPVGVLAVLASDPGVGKTRFAADLLRRVYHALPWPDGRPATLPKGSRALWVAADNQHPELGSLPGAFGFPPEALVLNATKANPLGGTMLDSPEEVAAFERHIALSGAPLVFIDTSLNATERSAHKPEDAVAFFKPLQEISARRGVVMLALTHLNAEGAPLGRRIVAQARVVMQLERPDPEGQPHRRKLHVTKSNCLPPPPLGVTMGAAGNEYDDKPPCPPEKDAGDRDAPRTAEAAKWLRDRLGASGEMAVYKVREAAEAQSFQTGTLYRAKERLGIEEFVRQGKKWWKLPATEGEE